MITETLNNLLHQTAFFNLDWGNYVMIAVACFFLYLAIKHEFEPLLLVPIAFGMLLVNIYPDIMAEPYTDVQGLEHAGGLAGRVWKMCAEHSEAGGRRKRPGDETRTAATKPGWRVATVRQP